MREIKFRAWHKTNEAMMTDVKNVYTLNNTFQDGTLYFMQFTGLQDRTGVDIYEGDILTVWIQGHKQITPYIVEDMRELYNETERDDSYYRISRMEIIGNIHQHKNMIYGN